MPKKKKPKGEEKKVPGTNITYTVQNIVASSQIPGELDLYKMAMELDEVEYEPEQFPGAILRISKPKVTLLVFKNGKLICSGAHREEDIQEALKRVEKLLKGFAMN